MKKNLIIFFIALIIFLISFMPATMLTPYLEKIANFNIKQISGTVWNGSIATNHFVKMSWNVRPIYLLLGKIYIDINTKINKTNNFTAVATINLSQNITLENLNGKLTSSYLQQLLPSSALQKSLIAMQAIFNIKQTNIYWNDINNQLPRNANGLVSSDIKLLNIDIGNYLIDFKYIENALNATIKSTKKSSIDVNLSLNLVKNQIIIKGTAEPKNKNIEKIFKELNISNKLNYNFYL